MRPKWLRNIAIGFVLISCGARSYAQPVQGEIKAVGFKAPVPAGFVVREGQWFPILVQLTAVGSEHQQVELRYEGIDLDGDRVSYVEKPVVLTAGGDRMGKRVWCYAVEQPSPAGETPHLDVIGQDGGTILKLLVPAAEPLPNDTLLVLDVSERPVTYLRALRSGGRFGDAGAGARTYYRSIEVGEMPAAELPDRWIGLEAVNVIFWDQPDPDKLSIAQLDALKLWVRNGGQLIIGLGASWPRVQKSALAEILPVQAPPQATEATITTQKLPQFFKRLVSADYGRANFKAPIAVATAIPKPGAVRTFWDTLPNGETANLIVMHSVGSGRVTTLATSMLDLIAIEKDTPGSLRRQFLLELLDLNINTPDFLKNEGNQTAILANPNAGKKTYEGIVRPTEFQRAGSFLAFAAIGFVVAYILAATGSWFWLRRHNLTYLSWTVFAAFAVGASALSLLTVGVTRGFSRVHTMSLIDLEADSSEARVACWFGFRSPTRQWPSLALPGDNNFLRPLTPAPQAGGYYATPERYEAVAAQALLNRTPLRATLKQFEGFWQGQIQGTVRGQLIADRATGRILPESWLKNDLNQKIAGGWLLYIDPRNKMDAGDVPLRVAGLTKNYRGREVPAGVNVLAVELGPLAPGAQFRGDIGAKQYKAVDGELALWNPSSQKEMPDLATLFQAQYDWVGGRYVLSNLVGGLDTLAAALMASTRGLYLHCKAENYKESTNQPLSTDGLTDRDVTHWLTRGQAVLLLYADEPGPVNLYRNGEPLETSEGKTLYRVRIPIQYRGQPPQGQTP